MNITILRLTSKLSEISDKTEYLSDIGSELSHSHDVTEKRIPALMLGREMKACDCDLVIVADAFRDEKGFRSRFAPIISRAERKAQERPSTKAKKRKKEVDTVTYNRKKTHIFPIDLDGKTAYAFTLGKFPAVALPVGTTYVDGLPEKVIKVFADNEDKYPGGYSLTEKTLRVLSFSQRHLPIKSDPLSEKVRKVVVLVALCAFIVAGYMFIDNMFIKPAQNEALQSEIRTIFYSGDTEILDENGNKVKSTNWKKLRQINSDIIGWIKINNTKIDYPIVQCKTDNKDEQFYLKHNVKKEYSDFGAIFMDYRSKKGLNSKNAIIHGHHMDDGSMFANLTHYGMYSGDLGFYKKAPTVTVNTPSRGEEIYKIISVFKSNVNPAQGEYFDFYCPSFKSDAQFMNYVYNLRVRSLINCPVKVNADDQLLTLVTCSYEFTDFRTIVVARKCRKNESKSVNVSKASVNSNPVWPQCYYSFRGGSRPVVTTFKTEYKKGNIKWYDGKGRLKGSEQLPTTVKIEEKPTQPTTAKPTETAKPTQPKQQKYSFKIISRGKVIKKGTVKKGTSVKVPSIKSFKKGGYVFSLLKWRVKGFGSKKYISRKYSIVKANSSFVMKAVFKKTKIKQPQKETKPTKPAKPSVNPTKPHTTEPEPTEPDTEIEAEYPTDPEEE